MDTKESDLHINYAHFNDFRRNLSYILKLMKCAINVFAEKKFLLWIRLISNWTFVSYDFGSCARNFKSDEHSVKVTKVAGSTVEFPVSNHPKCQTQVFVYENFHG